MWFLLACQSGPEIQRLETPDSVERFCKNDEIFLSGGLEIGPGVFSLKGLECLTGVAGDFRLVGNPEIQDLSGLEGLKDVRGDLILEENSALTSLTGLQNLEQVGGELTVGYQDQLLDMEGLNGLENVGGEFYIKLNAGMQDLKGLEALKSVGGLYFKHNGIVHLTGLEGLEEIWGNLDFEDNDQLLELQLPLVQTVKGYLDINNNNLLTDLSGLDSIVSIEKSLYIARNLKLVTPHGLERLQRIGGELVLDNNGLTQLDAFESLTTVDGDLSILYNLQLPTSTAEKFAASLQIGGTLRLEGNGQ
jgi:hypothetical protein